MRAALWTLFKSKNSSLKIHRKPILMKNCHVTILRLCFRGARECGDGTNSKRRGRMALKEETGKKRGGQQCQADNCMIRSDLCGALLFGGEVGGERALYPLRERIVAAIEQKEWPDRGSVIRQRK